MAKTIDTTEFETIEATKSEPALHDALQGTVQGECNALIDSASMHSPQCKGFTIKEIAQQLKVAKRTAYKYVKDVIEVWYWLSESEFRNEGIYTQFALSEMLRLKEMKSKEAYRELVHDENVDKLQVHEVEAVEQSSGVDGWLNPSALATYNQAQETTSALATYDYQQTNYLTIGQQSLADSQAKLASSRTQSFDLSNRLLTQLSLLAQDKQQQEVARQQEITSDIDSYALQQAHIQLAKILKGEQLASEVDALYRKGVSPEEIGKMLNGLQSANFNGDVKKS